MRTRTESNSDGRRAVRVLLVANLLPLAGLVGFEWQVSQALFVYWVELGATVLLYFGVVLFAQRESKPNLKRGGSYPGPIPIPRRSGSIQLGSWLPPIRYQNVRFVPAAFVLVALVWFVSSRAFLEYPNFDLFVTTDGNIEAYQAYITAAYSLEGLAMAVALFGVRAVFIARDFFGRRLVDQYSAAMVVEIPCRIALFWFGVLIPLTPIYLLAAATGSSSGTFPAIASGSIATIVVLSKLAVDRALVQHRHRDEPGRFADLFAPNQRKPESQLDTERPSNDRLQ
ncbi:DUF6498-containing protein [Natrialba sp. PRR66]|uniref:DUF6498-containing protein n=1 Tax=Natrialba sp. PRR66 TaxID=3098146 RepID=UPI002B1DBA81|nr:DUF6498-containing protein [Natrialba sp. PRR66]